MCDRRCIAVVSPFLDKRHGTEGCVAAQVERLARDCGYEVHLYCQRVEDLAGVQRGGGAPRAGSLTAGTAAQCCSGGTLIWHKVPDLPGPLLLRYPWWFVANQLWRWGQRWFLGRRFDLVFSPGVNCLDADLVAVHIVFAEFHRQVKNELRLRRNPPSAWARLLHRRLYYRLLMALEGLVYRHPHLPLAAVSRKVAADLARFYGRHNRVRVVYHGLDLARFRPENRAALRAEARRALELPEDSFAVLLVGNDWKKKGLGCLLEAAGELGDRKLRVLVVGRDDPSPYREAIARHRLGDRVRFLPPRPDVETYYAAADLYVGPSLEDAFALPPAEAMACGLPVIVSRQAGVSEIIRHASDGMILEDPADAATLAGLIRGLREDAGLRQRMGQKAAETARLYTWERNVAEMKLLFEAVIREKQRRRGARLPSEESRAPEP